MKAAHFILNTDYITSQNDADYTISVSVPSTFTVPRYSTQQFKTSIDIKDSATKDYRCYLESTAFDYALVGVYSVTIKFGNDDITARIERTNDKYTLIVEAGNYDISGQPKTFNGQSQVITAHIQTFVDPFLL